MNNELDLKPSNYTLDKDTCFEILPKQGTFERNETKVFDVIFSSTKVTIIFFLIKFFDNIHYFIKTL